jgi:light-regulated signal transduction histidine kinase (bacteriophytochrome)
MGVRGSMSFSINVDGKLWGLFACHHYTPRLVSYERRVVCEQAAMMFIYKLVTLSSAAARLEQRRTALTAIRSGLSVGEALVRRIAAVRGDWSGPEAAAADTLTRRALEAVYSEVSWLLGRDQDRESPPVATGTGLTEGQQLLLSLVEADSAAVLRGGRVYRIGDGRNGGAPSEMSVYAIASMFGRELPDLLQGDMHVFATDCLSAIVPAAVDVSDRAAGVLAVALSLSSPTYLLWFRREQVVHATWAGNPNARAPQGTASGLNPRASFEAWKQDIRNMSRSWELLDVQIADELADAIRGLESGRVAPAHPAPVAQPVARPHPFINQGALQQPSRRIVRISSY